MLDFSKALSKMDGSVLQDPVFDEIGSIKQEPLIIDEVQAEKDGKLLTKNVMKDITFKSLCVNLLAGLSKADENLSGEAKLKRFVLGQKIQKSDEPIELGIDELKEIKDLVGKSQAPLVVGQVWNFLEGK